MSLKQKKGKFAGGITILSGKELFIYALWFGSAFLALRAWNTPPLFLEPPVSGSSLEEEFGTCLIYVWEGCLKLMRGEG